MVGFSYSPKLRKKRNVNIQNPEELLSHADFVRYLARSLVFDENKAADVAQDTLMAGLEHPPAEDKPLRAWLAGVARNFTRKEYRGVQRRRAREQVVAAQTENIAPSASEIAAREEIRRSVVEAVQALEEPWRSVILLRYYEGLPHKEVAERLDIPLETMRTRLKRGLAKLRERLDTMHGGERNKWMSALAPLAYITGSKLRDRGFSLGTDSQNAFPTKALIKLVVSAALVSAVSIGIWQLLLKDADPTVSEAVMNDSVVNGESAGGQDLADGSDSIAKEDSSAQIKEPVAPSPREVTWKGRLIDYDGKPKAGVPIELYPLKRETAKDKKMISLVSAGGGLFEFKELMPGEYSLWLTFDHPGKSLSREDVYRYNWGKVNFEEPGIVNKDILVAEGNGGVVAGTVIDDATGKPYLRTPPSHGLIDYYVYLHNIKNDLQLTSEVDPDTGAFCFRNVPSETFDLYLIGPGYHMAYNLAMIDIEKTKIADDIELHVPPLGKIRTTILDFSREELRELKMYIQIAGHSKLREWNILGTDYIMEAPEGKACFKFEYKSMGTLTRSFEVKAGLTSEVVVSRRDFGVDKTADGSVTLCFKRSDGTPLSEALVGFSTKKARLLPDLTPPIKKTDEEGYLKIDQAEPGIWYAWHGVITPEEAIADLSKKPSYETFPDTMDFTFFNGIAISESRDPETQIDLKIPDTLVKGSFINDISEEPIQDFGGVHRSVFVGNPIQYLRSAEAISIAREGSEFTLRGIKPGDYYLGAAIFGYELYQSELITVEEGRHLDLGKIPMTPVGTVEIDVKDDLGNPIRFWVKWGGQPNTSSIFGLNMNTLETGWKMIGELPFGPITFDITTREYKTQTVTTELKPLERPKISITLKPEDRKAPEDIPRPPK